MKAKTRKEQLSIEELVSVKEKNKLDGSMKSLFLIALPNNEIPEFSLRYNGSQVSWRGWTVNIGDPYETVIKLVSLGSSSDDVYLDPNKSDSTDYIRYVKSGVNYVAYGFDSFCGETRMASKNSLELLKITCDNILSGKKTLKSLLLSGEVVESNGYFMVSEPMLTMDLRESNPMDIAILIDSLSSEYNTKLGIKEEKIQNNRKMYLLEDL